MSKNKYANLISNTVTFGVSTFGSKVLSFALTAVIARVLTKNQSGDINFITTACNLILPIMYLCIAESVIRFGVDKAYRKRDVFSVSVWTVLVGFAALWIFYPLLGKIQGLENYRVVVYLYCLSSALRTVVTNFVRASGFIKLFAIDGIFTTGTTITFSLLLLGKAENPVAGYVMGTVLADALSAVGLFLLLRLHRFLRIRGINKETRRQMFQYALPLIPTAIAWWITNLSDTVFIRYMLGVEEQGIYGFAYRIPNLIMYVSTFFTRAWELSAFTEYRSKEGMRFFSNVFCSYYALVFLMTSVLVLLVQPFSRILLGETFFGAWKYSVFLMLATGFSCLVTFLGAIYNAVKRNNMVSITTVIGAVINLALNALLIPTKMGSQGAALATLISFFVVFVIRLIDSRRFMPMNVQPLQLTGSIVLLVAQALIALAEIKLWALWESIILILLIMLNFRQITFMLRHGLSLLDRRRAPN